MMRISRSASRRFFCVLIAGLLTVSLLYLALPKSPVKAKGSSKTLRQAPKKPTPQRSPQTMYAPLTGLQESAGAELALNNNGPEKMEVKPTFYNSNGEAFAGKAVTLGPTEVRHVNLNELMPPNLRGQQKLGGVELNYVGGMMEVVAQITLFGQGNAGSVDILFSAMMNYQSSAQEAVWWMPRLGTATIILGNASDQQISASLLYSTGETETVMLAPRATEVVTVRDKQPPSPSGGIAFSASIAISGPVGSLRATGYVNSADKKFTSGIRFYDLQTIRQQNLFATNLKLGNAALHMTLKNTTDAAITATPRCLPASGEAANPVELTPIAIGARQSVEVDLRPLAIAASRRGDLSVVSAQVLTDGEKGSLIGALVSTDLTTQITRDVPLRDSGPRSHSTGGYPWQIGDDYSTVVSITNLSDQPTKFIASVKFAEGKYQMPVKELAVGETILYDLKKLRDEQTPDKDKQVIPLTVQSGQFHWSAVEAKETTRLIGRTEVISPSRRVSSSFSCPVCCLDNGPYGYFSPNQFTLIVDGFATTTALGDYINCYGYPSFTGWPLGL